MIIFSEIGDKTFLIAAILAMRHPRAIVFAGAISSLVVMSILSAIMGHLLPTLIPKTWTQFAAAVLFLVFGTKMVVEARQMEGGNKKIREEMKEAEEEIEDDDAGDDVGSKAGDSIPLDDLEAAKGTLEDPARSPVSSSPQTSKSADSVGKGLRNFCSLFLGPVFVQAFILTFLGEWGDRSQIATIALGAAHVSKRTTLVVCLLLTHYVAYEERIPCNAWDHRRTFLLYGSGRYWREIRLYEDLS
jgi:putative Ca2+/H+ antiporter (TMEM165/GDT1 family)